MTGNLCCEWFSLLRANKAYCRILVGLTSVCILAACVKSVDQEVEIRMSGRNIPDVILCQSLNCFSNCVDYTERNGNTFRYNLKNQSDILGPLTQELSVCITSEEKYQVWKSAHNGGVPKIIIECDSNNEAWECTSTFEY